MKADTLPYSVLLDSIHGPLILPRHDRHQPVHLLRTGRPHIQGEIEKLLAIVSVLPDQPLVLDIGANAGLISVPLGRALRARGGVLHAFEAQRLIYYMLAGNIALNGLANVHCHHLAVADQAGLLTIPPVDYLREQDFGMVQLTAAAQEGEQVQAITVDALQLTRCDLMKVDVEGMEMQVLAGASATLTKHRPWVWVEYWLAGRDALAAFFLQRDYRVWVMDELNLLCVPRERIPQTGFQVDAPELTREPPAPETGPTP